MECWFSIVIVVASLLLQAPTDPVRTVAASTGLAREQTAKPQGKLIIPWLEVNVPLTPVATRPNVLRRDHCIEGLEHWAKITDIAIVSTRSGRIDAVYRDIMRRKPANLHIIGGIKTYSLPGATGNDPRLYDFASPDGWKVIAAQARRIVAHTGNNVVLLENETALMPYHLGRESIDHAKLAKSLGALRDTGIEFWWNLPYVLPDSPKFPNRRKETARLVKTIADALPRSVLLIGYTGRPGWKERTDDRPRLRRMMFEIVGESRLHERVFCTATGRAIGDKRPVYTPAQAIDHAANLPGRLLIIYPGEAAWVSAGQGFADLAAKP